MATKNQPFKGRRLTLKERSDAAMKSLQVLSSPLTERVHLLLSHAKLSEREMHQVITAGVEPYTDPQLGMPMHRLQNADVMRLDEACNPGAGLDELEEFFQSKRPSRSTFHRRNTGWTANSAAVFGDESRGKAWRTARCVFRYLEAAEDIAFLIN